MTFLRKDHIDERTHTIKIPHELTKNKMQGRIVLSNTTWKILQDYIQEDRALLVAAFGAEDAGPLFLSESNQNAGQPISKWSITKIFEEIRQALGLPQLTPHKLRHLMLTHLMDNGLDLYEVSRYGRHRSIASTEIYLHLADSKLARQINKIHEQQWKRLESLFRERQLQIDVLTLFQQWRPTSYVPRQYFGSYLLGHVLQSNTLYWGWSSTMWESVIDAIPLRPNNVALRREPGYTTIPGPHSLLAHLAAYLFSDILYPTGKRGFPAQMMGEILFGQEVLQAAINKVMEPWLAMGYAENRRERFVFTTILALLANRNPHLEALTTTTLRKLREKNPSPEIQSRIGQLQSVLISLHVLPGEEWKTTANQPKLQLFQDEFVVDIHPR